MMEKSEDRGRTPSIQQYQWQRHPTIMPFSFLKREKKEKKRLPNTTIIYCKLKPQIPKTSIKCFCSQLLDLGFCCKAETKCRENAIS
ncbi:hypothetical protein EUGRSUZ_H04119 [Eucalyptus grandis]|uniref:Uncharacterized protein n=2 Tax=Eucalyptus grandis TaxID=71139 RepID=A0ACC3JX26_EUCGR|nr:hypothetical protein EUGRSUZ_H04119 [Eucalyptus grandis]